MSNQSQDNQKIDILINLLNFLYCLVPCYTESEPKTGTKGKKRFYALVYYCDEKFKREDNNNNSNNDFVKYKYKFNKKEKDIYLHRDTVDKVRGECQDCNFCDIVKNSKNFWDNLNIELITGNININNPDSYKEQDGKKKISIYQIDKQSNAPTPVFGQGSSGLLYVNCDEDKSIFIKDNVYKIENIYNQSQNQNQQNQNQKNMTESLLELKKLLITKTTEIILEKTSIGNIAEGVEQIVNKLMK
jgi:hypothetical protein